MRRYVLERILHAVFSLLAVSLIVFVLVRMSGNPVDQLIGEYNTLDDRARIAAQLGLDKPLPVQYLIFIGNAIRGDFGKSAFSGRPALEMVLERVPATLELGAVATIISLIIALPIGVYSAVKRGSTFDAAARGYAILGQSMPIFWLGIVLILIFAGYFRVLPAGGRDGWLSLILPAFTLGWYTSAGIMRLTRSSMLDVLNSEYVRLARAKGLSEIKVIWKHAFKNAAIPVVTFSAVLIAMLLAGSVVTETVFSWPGVGRQLFEAVSTKDFAVVQTIALLLSALYILANFAVDVLYGFLNPKIRFGE